MKINFKDDFIKQGIIIFFATSISGFFGLLFQLSMIRGLSPVDYGILNSLLAILAVISIPTAAVQTVITKSVSTFHAHKQLEKIKFLLLNSLKKLSLFSIAAFCIFALSSKHIASFLRLPTLTPVVIIGIIMVISVISPIPLGGLQGLQKFGRLGLTSVIIGVLKLILGIIFVWMGFKVSGALSGFALSSILGLILGFFLLRKVFRYSQDKDIDFAKIYNYFWPTILILLCISALTNMDVVLVKHFFKPIEAGYYSIAQITGKIILSLPAAIGIVMFPKSSNLFAKNEDTLHLLKKSLVLTALLCGIASLAIILFPSLVIKILSGKNYLICIPLVRLFAISMTFFALLFVILYYHLSVHNFRFIPYLIFFTILQLIFINLFHHSLKQVLYILCINSAFLFAINLYLIKPKIQPQNERS